MLGQVSSEEDNPYAMIRKAKESGATKLNVSGNRGFDLTKLTGLNEVTWLNLHSNHIADLTPLAVAGLTNLSVLGLGCNFIADLTPLAGLTKLNWLWLNDNNITDVSPLAGLTNLTQLFLEHNHISDVTPLKGLTNLMVLDLEGNPIPTYLSEELWGEEHPENQQVMIMDALPNCFIEFGD